VAQQRWVVGDPAADAYHPDRDVSTPTAAHSHCQITGWEDSLGNLEAAGYSNRCCNRGVSWPYPLSVFSLWRSVSSVLWPGGFPEEEKGLNQYRKFQFVDGPVQIEYVILLFKPVL